MKFTSFFFFFTCHIEVIDKYNTYAFDLKPIPPNVSIVNKLFLLIYAIKKKNEKRIVKKILTRMTLYKAY